VERERQGGTDDTYLCVFRELVLAAAKGQLERGGVVAVPDEERLARRREKGSAAPDSGTPHDAVARSSEVLDGGEEARIEDSDLRPVGVRSDRGRERWSTDA
jgi:hypothetical protein